MTELDISLENLSICNDNNDLKYGLHILLANGKVKENKDIVVGDLIMSEYGIPNKVIKINQKNEMLYNITQSTRGESYAVSGNHTLVLMATNNDTISWDKSRNAYRITWMEQFLIKSKRFYLYPHITKENVYREANTYLKEIVPTLTNYTKYKDILEIKVEDFINLPKNSQLSFRGFCVGLEFNNNTELPIDPYCVGQWIGDGTSAGIGMTTADNEIVEYFTEYAKTLNLKFKKYRKYHYGLTTEINFGEKGSNKFLTFLQDYNLIKNKHIPDIYKFSSRSNRLKLLAGLVDSDGSKGNGYYDFVFKSEKIVDDTIFLARSLGFRTNKKNCKRTCTNAPGGPKKGDYFRFTICGNELSDVPVLLERKKILQRETKKDAIILGIKINEIGVKQFNTFELDNNSKILLRDHTITKF